MTGRKTNTTRYSARNRTRGTGRPRYSTAAAAAAATHSDGYKPREERGWEEYHPDLDLESAFAVIPSEEVDGTTKSLPQELDADSEEVTSSQPDARTPRSIKRPGRPQRSQSSMLQSLLTPEAPKFVPIPGPNPRERLTLPKPSYRILDPFSNYDQSSAANFINQTFANVGYQENELFLRPTHMIRQMETSVDEDLDLMPDLVHGDGNAAIGGNGVGRVEYDMDEQDVKWLEALNKIRQEEGTPAIKPAIFEITMTKVEKEWHALEKRIPKPNPKAPQTQRPRSSSAAAVNGEPNSGEEPDSKCAICDDGDCENANAIVFCDGCDLAVHQECYGVPYIPEGQWLCRKCQLVGNARPSCIFCPNEGGAFKQTNNSKWAHLLCATWIPEVTIGNPSLMEPITDVEKVPNSRWKLGCYICKQDMGASIQCSDGRCYEPFHLTCARQARLYLKMKVGGGQNTLMETSQLRAYCHKHSPQDWKIEHRTERAFEKAVKHFKQHFQGQIWADSKASALAISDAQDVTNTMTGPPRLMLTNRKGQKPRNTWRLPSGAPVVPEAILKTIEDALTKFNVSKKKEFVVELCKYWTLKREARRGAALLKRLQLQMETFSSFEVTRRDYKAQGATGRARLERRIELAEILAKDLERIKGLVEMIKMREFHKLEEARLLRQAVDTVYFPVPGLLEPISEKAIRLDSRGVYHDELAQIRSRLRERYYSSVGVFLSDFAKIFTNDIGFDASDMSKESALYERPEGRIDNVELRERRILARRIMKAAYPLLQEAMRRESELNGRPFEQQMREMDTMLLSRTYSMTEEGDESLLAGKTEPHSVDEVPVVGKQEPHDVPVDSIENSIRSVQDPRVAAESANVKPTHLLEHTPPASNNGYASLNTTMVNGERDQILRRSQHADAQPPSPPLSLRDQAHVTEPATAAAKAQAADSESLAYGPGGVPWYIEPFDPVGTTIFEERWTGKDVLRDLSEELSDMDDDELVELGVQSEYEPFTVEDKDDQEGDGADAVTAKKNSAKKKKKGNGWADRSFRTRRNR